MRKKSVLTLQVMHDKINEYLLINYSQNSISEMVGGQGDKDGVICQLSAEKLYKEIKENAPVLFMEFEMFSSWESCQIYLIRDVLVVRRLASQVAVTA